MPDPSVSEPAAAPVLPPKPLGPFKSALLGGVVGTAVGAVINILSAKIFGPKGGTIANEAIDGAGMGAGIGMVVGYFDGRQEQRLYPLRAENAILKHNVANGTDKKLLEIAAENYADTLNRQRSQLNFLSPCSKQK